MISEIKNKNTDDHEQLCHSFIDDYVKYGENERYFIFLNNNMEIVMKREIPFLPFQFLLGDINAKKYSKLE